MRRVRGKDREPGKFRTVQAYIGDMDDRRRFIPPPPEALGDCIAELESFLQSQSTLDPLARVYVAHYYFEAVHPFRDGNGRVGRLLLSLMTHVWLNLDLPWLYMSEYFEKTRKEYIERLFAVSADGEWDEWIHYCFKGTAEQAASAFARCRKLIHLKTEYWERLGGRGKRLPNIIEGLFAFPVVKITDIEKTFDVSYETAKADVLKLVDAGVLTENDGMRPRTFTAEAIFDIAFAEAETPPGDDATAPTQPV